MKPLIVANWKCNPTNLAEAKQLFNLIKRGIGKIKKAKVVICPPFVYLPILKKSNLILSAQNCFWEESGPFTGEVSPKMLKDLGCQYVILGHSERRRHFGETDEMINKKLKAALKAGLSPIFCVGNKKKESEEDIKEIGSRLERGLQGLKKSTLSKLIVVYEPIWAISTTIGGVAATSSDAMEGAIYIRKILTKLLGKTIAQKIKILYGGSVDSKNINNFIYEAQMDGVLIGAASLNPKDFVEAVKNVSRT